MSAATEQRTTEIWTYVGRRTIKGEKVAYGWQDEQGETRLYAKPMGRPAVGSRYTITIEGEHIIIAGPDGPTYLDSGPGTTEQVLEWTARDRAAQQRDANRKQENRAKDHDLLRETLLPIRQLAGGRLAHADKAALFQALTAEFWRPLSEQEQTR